jgi:Protein of unknown function (DUF3226)
MNTIIVESKNDKAFVNALITNLNLLNIEVDAPIISISENDYVLLGGLDPDPNHPTSLINKLKDIKTDIRKKGINNIGIILDIDNESFDRRFLAINNAIKEAFNKEYRAFTEITEVCSLFPLEFGSDLINFACYFTNIEESGDLETLLRQIAVEQSDFADCLETWKTCIESKGHTISEKDFDKFWVSNYLRFDTCSRKESTQAGKYCSFNAFEYIMKNKPHIFNLQSDHLEDLSTFLRLFS